MIREPNLGRGTFHLITPIGLRRVAKAYGNSGYIDINKGISINEAVCLLMDYLEGNREGDPLAKACVSIMQFMCTKNMLQAPRPPRPIGAVSYDLIPYISLERLAIQYEKGAEKYRDRNWEKGGYFSRHLNSAIRHLFKTVTGMNDEDHAAAAVWNILCIMHHEVMIERGLVPSEMDDMPNYFGSCKADGSMNYLEATKV
jgi:hypothetical protein